VLAAAVLAWVVFLGFFTSAVGTWWMALTHRTFQARIFGGVALAAGATLAIAARDDLGLQKLISTLVMPTGLFWLALGAFALWAFSRGEKGLGGALLVTWILYSVTGNSWLAVAMVTDLEDRVPPAKLAADEVLDAIVVPGGGAGFNRFGEAQLGDYGDRVMAAARLYRAGRARYLVTTGSSISSISAAQDLSDATRIIWVELGIPDEAIIRIPEPKNTSEEIAATKRLVDTRKWTRVGMVGSAYHLPRILALCARADLSVVPIAADRRGGTPVWHPLGLIPSANSARTFSLVSWETLGRWVGR